MPPCRSLWRSNSQASVWPTPLLLAWGPSRLRIGCNYPHRFLHAHPLSNTDIYSFLKQTQHSRYRDEWEAVPAPKVLPRPSRMLQRNLWVHLPLEKDFMGWHHGNLPHLIQFTQQIFVKLLLFAKNCTGCWDMRAPEADHRAEGRPIEVVTLPWARPQVGENSGLRRYGFLAYSSPPARDLLGVLAQACLWLKYSKSQQCWL